MFIIGKIELVFWLKELSFHCPYINIKSIIWTPYVDKSEVNTYRSRPSWRLHRRGGDLERDYLTTEAGCKCSDWNHGLGEDFALAAQVAVQMCWWDWCRVALGC